MRDKFKMKDTRKFRGWEILIFILLLSSAVWASQENDIDNKNEEILSKVLEIDGVKTEEITISGTTIYVSIEASGADSYDSELIGWWASIFANSALLKGYEKDYLFVVIENTVNDVPYAYVSAPVVSIQDLMDGLIDDATFWDEVLITESKPKEKEIAEFSGLPSDLVYKTERSRGTSGFLTTLLWIIIILGVAAAIFMVIKKNPEKTKKIIGDIKKTSIEKGRVIKAASIKHGGKAAKSIAHHSKKLAAQIKDKSKKIADKSKEKIERMQKERKEKSKTTQEEKNIQKDNNQEKKNKDHAQKEDKNKKLKNNK
jgi:hypothetical protein